MVQKRDKSLLSTAIGKINKFIYGSETPYVKRDLVVEQMIKEDKYRMTKLVARQIFLRDKARARYVKHNERIRKLEDKITGNAYKVQSFSNRF